MFSWQKIKNKHAISPFAGISLVNSPVYQKCSLRSIIAQITFKQMSEGPLFVWLKLSENTTHFNTSFLQYRLIKNKPSILCFPILILMNISLWVSSGISLRSDLHGVAANSWYMQSCKTQTQKKSPKGLDFPEITKQGTPGNVLFSQDFWRDRFPLRSPVKSVVRMELGVWGAWGKAASSASAGACMTVRSQGHQVLSGRQSRVMNYKITSGSPRGSHKTPHRCRHGPGYHPPLQCDQWHFQASTPTQCEPPPFHFGGLTVCHL